MTYNSGTATDYIDLLDQLVQVVTGRNMATAAINAGGAGHAVGDVIDITATGSTSTEVAKIEVVTVAAGAITAIRIFRGGVYTADPTTLIGNAQGATTGVGTGATFDLTFAATGWTQLTRQSEVDTVPVVAAGGTGYSVADTLTLVGGVIAEGGAAATLSVATLSGSAVATVTILTRGDYEVVPTNAVLTSVSPAVGTGATLTVAWRDIAGDTTIVLQGDAGAAIAPLVGIKTYSNETDETSVNTVHNWALFSMTSWNAALAMHAQPNISDGFNTANDGTLTASLTGDGAFMPLKLADAFNISWWISATGRRVHLVAKVVGSSTTFYAQCSFGLLNQFGITTEFPFPAYVAAPSDRKRVWYRDTGSIWGGLSEVVSRANGPFFAWAPEGVWISAKAATIAANTSTTPTYSVGSSPPRATIWPLGSSNQHSDVQDQTWGIASTTGFDNDDLTLAASPMEIFRTPNVGGDLFPLFPVTVVQADLTSGKYRTFGELDGVWWFHVADSGASSEDRFTRGNAAYTIFQNGTRVAPFSFLALRED